MLSREEKEMLADDAAMDQFKQSILDYLLDLPAAEADAVCLRMRHHMDCGDDVVLLPCEMPFYRDLAACALWDLIRNASVPEDENEEP